MFFLSLYSVLKFRASYTNREASIWPSVYLVLIVSSSGLFAIIISPQAKAGSDFLSLILSSLSLFFISFVAQENNLRHKLGDVFYPTKPRTAVAHLSLLLSAMLIWVYLPILPSPSYAFPEEINHHVVVLSLLQTISAAIREELIFRFAMLGLVFKTKSLTQSKIVLATFTTTLLWLFLHGQHEQNLIGYLRILPLGLACSYVYIRHGILCAIALHCIYNICILTVGLLIVL